MRLGSQSCLDIGTKSKNSSGTGSGAGKSNYIASMVRYITMESMAGGKHI